MERRCQKRRQVIAIKATVMNFREARNYPLYAISESLINHEDFALFYDLNT